MFALWLLGYDGASMLLELREISVHWLHVFEHLPFDVSTLGRFLLLGRCPSLRSGYRIDMNRLWSLPVQKCSWKSWNATDVLMVQCCSSLFLFEFALCEFSMRWWSFEITCPISYFQTSLDPSLACGQSIRPPSPIDPWTEPLQKLSQAKCSSVSTISRKVPTDSLLCWRSFSSCVSRSQDTAVPFSCWTKSSALSAASKKIKNNTNTNRKS